MTFQKWQLRQDYENGIGEGALVLWTLGAIYGIWKGFEWLFKEIRDAL